MFTVKQYRCIRRQFFPFGFMKAFYSNLISQLNSFVLQTYNFCLYIFNSYSSDTIIFCHIVAVQYKSEIYIFYCLLFTVDVKLSLAEKGGLINVSETGMEEKKADGMALK